MQMLFVCDQVLGKVAGNLTRPTMGNETTRPTQQVHAQLGKKETMSHNPTNCFKHTQGSGGEIPRRHHGGQGY
jgi:hypothetical protein